MSHQDIADALGLTIETGRRTPTKLERKNHPHRARWSEAAEPERFIIRRQPERLYEVGFDVAQIIS
jgi:hypothetical protein